MPLKLIPMSQLNFCDKLMINIIIHHHTSSYISDSGKNINKNAKLQTNIKFQKGGASLASTFFDIQRHNQYYRPYSCSMRRKRSKNAPLKQELYTPQYEPEQPMKDDYHTKQKRSRYHSNNSRNQKTKTKSRELDDQSNLDDSQQSEIIDIRHGDQEARQHARPLFLKRWDGISNELALTQEEIKEFSPMMKVYWQTKAKNMNAIVFLQFGKMEFFAFENDAIKLNQLFKKKLKKFSKFLMVNFWCKEIEEVKKQLFAMKVPVLVMNQIEDQQYRQQYGLVKRAVVEVITPALFLQKEDSTPRSRLLVSVYYKNQRGAALVLDAQSNNFFVEQFEDDSQYHQIRRIFNKYHPVELIIPLRDHKEISKIARQICNPYINQYDIGEVDVKFQLSAFISVNPSLLFQQLSQLYEEQHYGQSQSQTDSFSRYRVVFALTLTWKYLGSLSLLQKVFYQGIFQGLNSKLMNTVPFFDSQVYENLEIFRIKSSQEETYAQPGTLMGYLNHCRTNHGRKLLHRWIDQPLSSKELIYQRQQAVQELLENEKLLDMHDQLMNFDRLEKRLGDIYHWVCRNYEKGKSILTKYINPQKQYDIRKNPAVTKLKEVLEILKRIKQYEGFLKKMSKIKIQSPLLRQFIQLKEIENVHNLTIQQINKIQGIPQIAYVADIILRRISFDEITGYIEPMPGQSEVFDEQKKEITRINTKLQEQLTKWKEHFQTQKITFVSVRAKNQIQIPKQAIKKSEKHKDLYFSSEIANFIRYTTHETNTLSEQIMQYEKTLAQSYEPFFQQIVQHFCKYKFLWNLYIKSMSSLDVLMSLAQAAKKMPVRCMPTFTESGLVIENGYHVNLLSILEEIVPNSIELGQKQKVLLLTGPNMGGKSTFLKQVCTFAVLAQIGSFIPAKCYKSIIYDQMFCRIGASDRIYQGKSTFYVELQQTKRILQKATPKSLVIIDQLGRGTSTFDGMAISESILQELFERIRCMTLYSTHYTQITEKFSQIDEVKLMKMGYFVNEQGKFSFTYQLVDGVAEKSFANNVGRMVKIKEQILNNAQKRSQRMHQQIKVKKQRRRLFHFIQDQSKTEESTRSKGLQ